jgi:hypothetical protein
MWMADKDGADPVQCSRYYSQTLVYAAGTVAATASALACSASLVSMDYDGFTLSHTADGTQRQILFAAFSSEYSHRNLVSGQGHTVVGHDNIVGGKNNTCVGTKNHVHGENGTVIGHRSALFNMDGTTRTLEGDDKFEVYGDIGGDFSTLSDGDKGDITVSSSGSVWTIDAAVVTEAKMVLADNTTNDVNTSRHGFTPKAPNDTTKFLRGDGSWAAPTSNAAAVTPSDVSGLKLWLKADAGVFSDAGTTPAVDTNTIQQWNDQSGLGNHATQATAGKRPTYKTAIQNGLAVVRFAGAHGFQVASLGLSTFTTLCVFKGTGTAGLIYELSATVASNDGCILFQDTTGSVQVKKGGTVSSRNSSSGWGITGQFLVSGQHYGGSHATHYILSEGAPRIIATNTGNEPGSGTTTDTLNIGSRNNAASTFFTGDLCEFVVYSPAISLQNVRGLVQYLQQRWDV